MSASATAVAGTGEDSQAQGSEAKTFLPAAVLSQAQQYLLKQDISPHKFQEFIQDPVGWRLSSTRKN